MGRIGRSRGEARCGSVGCGLCLGCCNPSGICAALQCSWGVRVSLMVVGTCCVARPVAGDGLGRCDRARER